jgi:uncharacterized metal-binding protein/predicted Fe-Mo cluster-binding NifX family protein
MRVVLPLFGSRVAPRCLTSREAILAEFQGEELRAREVVPLNTMDEEDLITRLIELEAGILVCGGLNREVEAALRDNGIDVINNVAGEADEILEVLREGRLVSGHGLGPTRPPAPPEASSEAATRTSHDLPRIDCVACADRVCFESGTCPHGNGAFSGLIPTREEGRLSEVARDVSAEVDPKLCRIAELVHFGLGMGYRRLGLAFCWELFEEATTLTRVLQRFFEVVPVCCRIGRKDEQDVNPCNPLAQAEALARAETDLNVQVGLCLGSDIVFNRRSRAPSTTLFVKDRSLAHNPVGAIYTRYHLEKLGGGVPERTRPPRRLP